MIPKRMPVVIVEQVFNPDRVQGHRAHMASLQILIDIILDNDAKYGLPEKVDAPDKS